MVPLPSGVGVGVAAWAERSSTTISVDVQFDRMPCRTSASRPSIVRVYRRRTSATRLANQHWFRSGSHSAASLPPFCERFTAGLASVRFSRSEANRRFVAASAALPASVGAEPLRSRARHAWAPAAP